MITKLLRCQVRLIQLCICKRYKSQEKKIFMQHRNQLVVFSKEASCTSIALQKSSMSAFIVCITMGSSLFRMEKPLYRNFLTYVQVKSRYEQGTFYFPALAKNALLEMDVYGRNLYGVCMSLNAACKNPSFQGNRIETQNCFYSKTIQLFFEFRATRIKNSLRLSVVELPLRTVNINMNYSFKFLSLFTHTSIKRLV